MAMIIGLSIDLNKIDKDKIIPGKNGAKYYNLDVMVNDQQNDFGKDVSVTEPQTKEQRKDKVKKTYLGNGKVLWKGESKSGNTTSEKTDKLPF